MSRLRAVVLITCQVMSPACSNAPGQQTSGDPDRGVTLGDEHLRSDPYSRGDEERGDSSPSGDEPYGDTNERGDDGWQGDARYSGDERTGDNDSPPLFDIERIRDPATIDCQLSNTRSVANRGVLLDVADVSFISWESLDGTLQPIRIRGYAAKPRNARLPVPGVVQAHGLGGFAREEDATGPAALLGTYALAYTGPGGGSEPANTSEGLPAGYDNGRRMFDTLPDPRGSWFWGHAVAAMRALTCLATLPGIDANRLGVTGYSAGAVATLIAAGVDSRIKAAVPLSGTLHWEIAVESPTAWQHSLLSSAGYTTSSSEWLALMPLVDAARLYETSTAKVLMVNGTCDEFFPLTAHVATYDAIGADRRTSLSGNFDHGCYLISGVENADDIAARAELRASGGQRAWFRHWFGTDNDYDCMPAEPLLSLTAVGAATWVIAAVDSSCPALDIEEVKVWWSNDDAALFGSVVLDPGYSELVLFTLQANTIAFVDVQYSTGGLFPERFALSSRPTVPAGHVPRIRRKTDCSLP